MSSWFCDTQLKDLPQDTRIMITCDKCRRQREESVRQLVNEARVGAMYLDLIEWAFSCSNFHCNGTVSFGLFTPVTIRMVGPQTLRYA
ncbi:hypothetical protein [Asticcacaulis benevestitus]|uniref:Uncharacterized protein n=1 Tax=Asticcacaulis benevestitus DSM 16100 = ATCC BAA-896 TaxID=1121022 RepID=V4R0P9_9CAUL|nr:hypothetical protein [Asticcacaulis benevestitus]ESQ84978.1 hypothetical protein ABENE_19360 [Asticcacaulis benevestitus DSM 16100 = ATCC BAA-896]